MTAKQNTFRLICAALLMTNDIAAAAPVSPLSFLAEDVLPASSEQTEFPTPTPTPRLPEVCPYYKLEAKNLGDGHDISATYRDKSEIEQLTDAGKNSCLQPLLDQIYNKCKTAIETGVGDDPNHPLPGPPPHGLRYPGWLDDCIVESYFFGLKNTQYIHHPSNINPTEASKNQCEENWGCGTFYFSQDCSTTYAAPIKEITDAACDAGYITWLMSPISLLLDESVDVDENPSIVSFPLDPTKSGKTYFWKASEKAPLLVYDPEHSGKITSAAQLFGDWTFGGKKTALAANHGLGGKWRDGYEALSQLDANGDDALRSEELAPLALWFDKNRDGISDTGEVRSLTDAGIVAVYFRPDGSDPVTKNITASLGYDRLIDGKIVQGSSVDWYAEGSDSASELVQQQIFRAGLQNPEFTAKRNESAEPVDPKAEPAVRYAAFNSTKNLSGLWDWSANEGPKQLGRKPVSGHLTFNDNGSGTLRGHSFGEIPFSPLDRHAKYINSMVNIFPLSGKISSDIDAGLSVEFEVTVNGIKLQSRAKLSEDGQTLSGTTKVNAPGTALKHFTYAWTARRR